MADVASTDKRLIEVYAFDLTVGSQDFEAVPVGLNDRRVIADADNNKPWGGWEPETYALNKSVLSDLCDCLSQSLISASSRLRRDLAKAFGDGGPNP